MRKRIERSTTLWGEGGGRGRAEHAEDSVNQSINLRIPSAAVSDIYALLLITERRTVITNIHLMLSDKRAVEKRDRTACSAKPLNKDLAAKNGQCWPCQSKKKSSLWGCLPRFGVLN